MASRASLKPICFRRRKASSFAGQALGLHLRLHGDDLLHLAQEPGIVAAGGRDLLHREAEAEGLGDGEQAVGGRTRELDPRRGGIGDIDIVEAGEAGLHGAQRLLHRLGEAAAHGHGLAHGFHRGGEQSLGAGEFLEGEARHLDHDIIDGRLEGGRRHTGDVIGELVEGVAHGELGGDLGDGKARRLGGERRGARDPRVHLDDDQPPVQRIDGELHVRAAGIDPDLAQHRDRGVAHDLVFLVGQGQRRRDGDAVAGMHPHGIDVLDGADDDAVVGAIAHDLHLELLPAEHRFLDQDRADGRGAQAPLDDILELGAVIGDAAAGAAEGEGGPDHGGQARQLQRGDRLVIARDQAALRALEPDAGHGLAEELAILGHLDGMGIGPDHLDAQRLEPAGAVQRHGGVEGGLAAHGGQQSIGALALDDARDDLRGDRLDIGGVGQLRVGHDGRRIGIDQDDPIALLAQRLAGLRPGIVELAGLTDDDRPGADDEDGFDVGALRHRGAPFDGS